MSLGSSQYSQNSADIVKSVVDNGALIVAAAGNRDSGAYDYPAGYDQVIGVTAVDENNNKASFAQYNDQVTLAAPGVDILSTVTESGGVALALTTSSGESIAVNLLEGAEAPKSTISAAPVDCGFADSTCVGADGRICIISRGGGTFEAKAANCEAGGEFLGVLLWSWCELCTDTMCSWRRRSGAQQRARLVQRQHVRK